MPIYYSGFYSNSFVKCFDTYALKITALNTLGQMYLFFVIKNQQQRRNADSDVEMMI